MELKELTDRTFELFGVNDPDDLGSALLKNISSTDKLKAFCDNEENRYLAEFRDALLPELMSGKIEVVDHLEETERGSNGFGSSGR